MKAKIFQNPLENLSWVCFIHTYWVLPGSKKSALLPVGLLTYWIGTIKKIQIQIVFPQEKKERLSEYVLRGVWCIFTMEDWGKTLTWHCGYLPKGREGRVTCLEKELFLTVYSEFSFLSVHMINLNIEVPEEENP